MIEPRTWEIQRLFVLITAFPFFFAVGYAFPNDLDYPFIIVASFSIVNYVMLIIDHFTRRWRRWQLNYLRLLASVLLTAVGADIWLHSVLPNFDSITPFLNRNLLVSFADTVFFDTIVVQEFFLRPRLE